MLRCLSSFTSFQLEQGTFLFDRRALLLLLVLRLDWFILFHTASSFPCALVTGFPLLSLHQAILLCRSVLVSLAAPGLRLNERSVLVR